MTKVIGPPCGRSLRRNLTKGARSGRACPGILKRSAWAGLLMGTAGCVGLTNPFAKENHPVSEYAYLENGRTLGFRIHGDPHTYPVEDVLHVLRAQPRYLKDLMDYGNSSVKPFEIYILKADEFARQWSRDGWKPFRWVWECGADELSGYYYPFRVVLKACSGSLFAERLGHELGHGMDDILVPDGHCLGFLRMERYFSSEHLELFRRHWQNQFLRSEMLMQTTGERDLYEHYRRIFICGDRQSLDEINSFDEKTRASVRRKILTHFISSDVIFRDLEENLGGLSSESVLEYWAWNYGFYVLDGYHREILEKNDPIFHVALKALFFELDREEASLERARNLFMTVFKTAQPKI